MARAMARWDRQILLALGSAGVVSCTNANAALPIERASSARATTTTGITQPTATTYELPYPIHDTNGTDKFYAWLTSSTGPEWASVDRTTARKCAGSVWCSFLGIKFKKLDVNVRASKDAYQLDLGTIPRKGVVMAWIRVVEDDETSDNRYGFKKGLDYYIVVESDTNTDPAGYAAGKWFLVQIDAGHIQTLADSGMFRRCANETKPDSSDAAFTKCSKTRNGSPYHPRVRELLASLRAAQQKLRAQQTNGQSTVEAEAEVKRAEIAVKKELIDEATGPAWVSCTHGCCIADGGGS